ncbi:type VI secretion system membrane subunit TssM [Arcobacter sp. FWKO B]|uniref:type VI secretion system membrane subunit TssM n=1 Tax=Arcobacter sp. FWKO B TaxID=2593672 RepID=UPI0019086682|nr:type VI secretion system membrane subunit TssM [Arcobacter sp. FWKO B]
MIHKIKNIIKKDTFKNPLVLILFASIFISLAIIFFGEYLSDSLNMFSLRLLIGFIIFGSTLIIVLLLKLYAQSNQDPELLRIDREKKIREREINKSVETIGKDIRNRFLQANKIIKNSSVYSNKSDTHYELPWYLIMGQEQEGKTSLIEYSGLDFPLNINYQHKNIDNNDNTKTFEWYFAENAIFIDTPGKYLNAKIGGIDDGVWKYFLNLFKKKRWKRPINGVILTISIETLMAKTDKEIESYAKELREKFDQLSDTFMSNIPIYLFITKSDLIKGFVEYFDSIEENEKNEILGFTFDASEKISLETLSQEMTNLLKRIDTSIIDKIHTQWDNDNRTKILLFCDELNEVFNKLKKFVEIGFAQTRYRTPLLLRGLYFTSVPQYSLPIYQENILDESTTNKINLKGWFSKKVLEDIVFVESNLIKMDSRHKTKEKRREIFAITSAIFIIVLSIGIWLFNYIEHKKTIENITKQLNDFSSAYSTTNHLSDFEQRLALLNRLLEIKNIDSPKSHNFWKLSFYKVKDRNNKIDELYHNFVEQFLLNDIKMILEIYTMNNLNNYDLTWENLKAYLMLENKQNREKAFLISWVTNILNKETTNNSQQKQQMQEHWKNLVEYGFNESNVNDNIVADARKKLSEFGKELVLYKQLKDKILAEELKDFQFNEILTTKNQVFNGTDYIIPSFYTKVGYHKVMSVNSKNILNQLSQYSWVLGESNNFSQDEINVIYQNMQMLYFEEYKLAWMNALNNLKIADVKTEIELEEQFKAFVSTNSPVIQILQALRDNTMIYSDSELLLLSSNKDVQLMDIDKDIEAKGTRYLRDSFEVYHQLLTETGQPSPTLANEIKKLETVSMQTFALSSSGSGADALNSIKSRVSGSSDPMSLALNPLPSPVSSWFTKSLHNNWIKVMTKAKSQINEQYTNSVYSFYANNLINRYPMNSKAKIEVTLSDFEEFFKKNGILDRFFENYLSYFVKIDFKSNSYELRKIDGVTMPIDNQIINAIILSQEIRRRFFTGSGDKLESVFFIKPTFLSKNYSGMLFSYDNNILTYEHGPLRTRKISWPVNRGNTDTVFILSDLNRTQQESVRVDGDWSLFKIFTNFKFTNNGTNSMIVEYNKDGNKASFEINGSAVQGFMPNNVMTKFKLKESI